jgi:hypothetical protein
VWQLAVTEGIEPRVNVKIALKYAREALIIIIVTCAYIARLHSVDRTEPCWCARSDYAGSRFSPASTHQIVSVCCSSQNLITSRCVADGVRSTHTHTIDTRFRKSSCFRRTSFLWVQLCPWPSAVSIATSFPQVSGAFSLSPSLSLQYQKICP